MTRAYLILHVHGSASSVKSASTSKTGDGESGMTSGLASFRQWGISNVNHAALLICGLPREGQAVYLSFYPAGGGFFANGAFVGVEADELFEGGANTRIYRIDGLNPAAIATYLEALNARIQRQILLAALEHKLRDTHLTSDKRAEYGDALARERGGERIGYDALRHNCTSVVVAALREGGLAVAGTPLATPSWLDGVGRKDPAHYHRRTLDEFTSEMREVAAAARGRAVGAGAAGVGVGVGGEEPPSFLILRPHAAYPYGPMVRLGRELLEERYREPVPDHLPPTAEELAAVERRAAAAMEARAAAAIAAMPPVPRARRVARLGDYTPRVGAGAGGGGGGGGAPAPAAESELASLLRPGASAASSAIAPAALPRASATVRGPAVPADGSLLTSSAARSSLGEGAGADSSASEDDEARGEGDGGNGLGPR